MGVVNFGLKLNRLWPRLGPPTAISSANGCGCAWGRQRLWLRLGPPTAVSVANGYIGRQRLYRAPTAISAENREVPPPPPPTAILIRAALGRLSKKKFSRALSARFQFQKKIDSRGPSFFSTPPPQDITRTAHDTPRIRNVRHPDLERRRPAPDHRQRR